MSNSLNQIVNKYENIFLAGDLNINLLDSKGDPNDNFSVLRDLNDLKTLVKVLVCCKNLKSTILDAPITNKTNGFQKTIVCKTGFNLCHIFIATNLMSTFIKLLPKTVKNRSYKNFHEIVFFIN